MMHRRSQRGVPHCLAAMVLMGSMMPPACEHAHAGGQTPHRHVAGELHDHGHFHGQRRLIGDDHDLGDALQLLSSPVAHAHWTFLVFHLAWPTGHEEDRSRLADSILDEALARRPADYALAPLSDGSAAARIVFWQAGAAIATTISATWSPPLYHTRTRILLCDTARHERSGVQLI